MPSREIFNTQGAAGRAEAVEPGAVEPGGAPAAAPGVRVRARPPRRAARRRLRGQDGGENSGWTTRVRAEPTTRPEFHQRRRPGAAASPEVVIFPSPLRATMT